MDDTISRAAAIAEVMCLCEECPVEFYIGPCPSQQCDVRIMREALENLPPAQPNLSEAYSKAVFAWLRDYQIRAAELKGKYTPYEVLSWVINDWRKEHEQSD